MTYAILSFIQLSGISTLDSLPKSFVQVLNLKLHNRHNETRIVGFAEMFSSREISSREISSKVSIETWL